ncbi:MAG: hypothetical protein ACRBF0_15385 [Calditrichia bacterium]
MKNFKLNIDLEELNITEVELFTEEGTKGIPAFAASCSSGPGLHSCVREEKPAPNDE